MANFTLFVARGNNPQARIYTNEELQEMWSEYPHLMEGFFEEGEFTTREDAQEALERICAERRSEDYVKECSQPCETFVALTGKRKR